MTAVFRSPEFVALRDSGHFGDLLGGIDLDFPEVTGAANPLFLLTARDDDTFLEVSSFSTTAVEFSVFNEGGGGGATPRGAYTVTITGDGFGVAEDAFGGGGGPPPEFYFGVAIGTGQAVGRVDSVRVDFQPFDATPTDETTTPLSVGPDAVRVLDMTITSGGYTLETGDQRFEIAGTLPTRLE